ncbi:MAG: large conductance mechanosensitive channel protein MscL [Clostridia bacterium]|nr:large conductance mechanosensitive channel protein MscL [Clostridia bacterium]
MKKFWADFKKFISRGNVVDMAVGVAVASAFTAIVKAFTNGFISPLLALLSNGSELADLKWVVREAVVEVSEEGVETIVTAEVAILWGAFLQAIFDFLIIALALFIMIRVVAGLSERAKKIHEKMMETIHEKELAEKRAKEEEEKAKAEEEARIAEEKAEAERLKAEAAAEAERERLIREEQLLTEIRDLLKEKK